MKRLLIYPLLLAHLCSGLAFAWDTHPGAMAGHDLVAFDQPAGESTHHTGSEPHHDSHSCHGAAHLIGIIHNTAIPVAATGQNEHTIPPSLIPSRYIAPHLRPPIT